MNNNKPRIAIVNDQPPSSGTGNYAWHLAELALRAESISAEHIYLDYPGRRVVKNPGTSGEAVIAGTGRVPLIDNRPWFWRRSVGCLRGYDVVHFTSQNMSFLCGAVAGRTIVTCLDVIPVIEPEGLFERFWREYLYSGLKRAGRIIAISEATKRDVVRHCGVSGAVVDVIPLGVGPEYRPRDKTLVKRELGLPEDRKIILHIGTAARRKRIPLLLDAFARSRACQDALLVRIGRASPGHRSLAARLGISERVRFLEGIDAEKLPLYYSAADLLVFPSSYEGFGLPPLEAMASGCPVIAADNSSIPEVVGDAGVLVGSNDPSQWAMAIDSVLGDAKKATELSVRGLNQARRFSWEQMMNFTGDIYRQI
jgi:glycosyltransferase involved in cell wall biosynthesis